jgi:hypothetical protein
MKHLGLSFQVRVKLELTSEDIGFLIELANHHYDALCRATASSGADGFLWGALNSIDGGKTVAEWTFRECDLVLKILETANYIVDTPVGDWRSSTMRGTLMTNTLKIAMEAINFKTGELNT